MFTGVAKRAESPVRFFLLDGKFGSATMGHFCMGVDTERIDTFCRRESSDEKAQFCRDAAAPPAPKCHADQTVEAVQESVGIPSLVGRFAGSLGRVEIVNSCGLLVWRGRNVHKGSM